MSLSVLVAHTGIALQVDPGQFTTLDALRTWIAEHASVPVPNQIHITAGGKQVKLNTLLTEKKIFVFDRQTISSAGTTKPVEASPFRFNLAIPPDFLASQNDLASWQELFQARKTWASGMVGICATMAQDIQDRMNEISVIEQATGVALANLENHVKNLQAKHTDAGHWATEVLRDQENTLIGWDEALRRLAFIPIKENLLHFISGMDPHISKPNGQRANVATLAAIVNVDNVRKAGSTGPNISKTFQVKMGQISTSIDGLTEDARKLGERIQRLSAESVSELTEEASKFMEDVEAVANKVNTDYDHVLELPSNSKSVSQASKMALRHTKNALPSISETATDLGKLLQQVSERKDMVATTAIYDLQNVSTTESRLAALNEQLTKLDVDEAGVHAFELLGLVQRLPSLYGSLLAEAIRRREWNERVKAESATLQEEVAVLKEEEERRRKRWQKSTGAFILPNVSDAAALGVEINVQGEERIWPQIQRKDLDEFVEKISSLGGMESVVKEMNELIKALDRPTRAQSRRAKSTFKNGSIHEANLGRSSLLIRPDDELLKKFTDEKVKLTEKLRGSESRIRKLEDLLHRQSQMSRQSSGNIFQVSSSSFEPQPSPLHMMMPPPSPRDAFARLNSAQSRPGMSPISYEDRSLAQRIVGLEAELIAEREHGSGLEKEISVHLNNTQDYKDRLDDADSAKKDLVANLDAQQIEHANERKLLEQDLQNHKLRLEELEDELDRMVGSRDKEKIDADGELKKLGEELENNKRSSQATMDALLADIAEYKGMSKKLRQQLETGEAAQAEHTRGLKSAHMQLDSQQAIPQEFKALVEAIETLTERSVNEKKELEVQLSLSGADTVSAQKSILELTNELSAVKDKLVSEEMESFTLRETLAEERAIMLAVRRELEEERMQLASVRRSMSEGETGSKPLQDRLTEEEGKIAALSEQLAAEKARSQSHRNEIDDIQRRAGETQSERQTAFTRFESRSNRTKDLTQRLFAYYERLIRLTESLGFVITWQDDEMTITRPSRSTNGEDPSASLNRSVSGPQSSVLDGSNAVDLVYWMQADDADAEAKRYVDFVNTIGKFDVEIFREAITKRVKEVEHVARKWQKEARGYRDKYHRAQMDAHQKIAYRSFKEGDLALFLPTRNQATRPWAAFNVGAPHYFLREQDTHKLRSRDWLLARISRVEERVVDLSKSISHLSNTANHGDRRSLGEVSDAASSFEDENPFELSDGLRWYMLDASEEKPGAPTTPGLAKSTVASAAVDATGSVRIKKSVDQVSKTLSKSLASRRSSTNSRAADSGKASPVIGSLGSARGIAPPQSPTKRGERSSDPVHHSRLGVEVSQDGGEVTEDGGRKPPSGIMEAASAPRKSTTLSTSPAKSAKGPVQNLWDSLFSLDVSLESGKNIRGR